MRLYCLKIVVQEFAINKIVKLLSYTTKIYYCKHKYIIIIKYYYLSFEYILS